MTHPRLRTLAWGILAWSLAVPVACVVARGLGL